MRTRVTVRTVPRSSLIHCPSPLADQRVDQLLSTALPGTLPSLVLAVTPAAPGVTSTSAGGTGVAVGAEVAVGRGVGVGVAPGIGVAVAVGRGVAVGTGVGAGVPDWSCHSASAFGGSQPTCDVWACRHL